MRTYIVLIDGPYYTEVHHLKTLEEVEAVKDKLLKEHSEDREYNATITVALVLDEENIKIKAN